MEENQHQAVWLTNKILSLKPAKGLIYDKN